MKPSPPRMPSILDAMILVAATAAGFALIRATGMDFSVPAVAVPRANYPFSGITSGMRLFIQVQHGLSALLPFLATWTLAAVVIRLRQPRPRLRKLVRQPGTIACVTAMTSVGLQAMWILPLLAVGDRFLHPRTLFITYGPNVGLTVLGAWITLALGGWWRSEPSWIDRLGRALGLAWIAVNTIAWGRHFLTVL